MYYYFMSPLLIHGVKHAFIVSLFLSVFFLLIYCALLSTYWLYPTGAVIAILIVTGIVVLGGLSDLFFFSWGRYQKYRKMKGRFLEVAIYRADPLSREVFDHLMGFYEVDGIMVRKPLVASFSHQETKSHQDGQTYHAWLASNGDLVLLEKQN
jgi:hypothetical protein